MSLQELLAGTLLGVQFIAVIVAALSWPKVKHTHWKWFVVYLFIILIVEAISRWGLAHNPKARSDLYDYFGIPFQFLFFYWLYAYKSLKNKRLFWLCSVIYLLSYLPYFTVISRGSLLYSFTYTVGNVVLMILVLLELSKQIKSDDILMFRTNYMFYINFGIMLFYIGTLPFFSFYGLILKDEQLWNGYYYFFMSANHIMYLLFISAFIWGKRNTY